MVSGQSAKSDGQERETRAFTVREKELKQVSAQENSMSLSEKISLMFVVADITFASISTCG